MNKLSFSKQRLSPREMQALYLIVCGRSTKEVAERLRISVHTAQHHRRCIYEKLNVRNSAQLMREAFLDGWLGTPGSYRRAAPAIPGLALGPAQRKSPGARPGLGSDIAMR